MDKHRPVNDPEITAREAKAARQEQGYLAGELIDNLRAIRDSAMDGRDCPEWLRERLQDAECVLAKADAERFGVTTGNELLAALKKLTGLIRDCHNVFQNHSASWMMQQPSFKSAETLIANGVALPRLDMTGMRCQEASKFSFQRYIACGQPATKMVLSERGRRLYPMCDPCADHNIRNRDAKLAAVHEAMDV